MPLPIRGEQILPVAILVGQIVKIGVWITANIIAIETKENINPYTGKRGTESY